ncbi:MAG TPA: aminoacyl-tRNA hydrolase [Spongiibacteraceae bacterium]|nr:aminoacyl-tRNA hydrolase [Spongiibacteraceae bacterium]HUH37670.1 aminoacyl-tRNA hydrolase [Spongiibacteraceae bacterium]
MNAVTLIVGLGNPGREYERTRHNAGAWFVQALADQHHIALNPEPRYHGLTGRGSIHGHDVRLLVPTTFMNRSGQAVAPMAGFFKIPVEEILVAHDELDLQPGDIRLKRGGSGGGNGVKDIQRALGNNGNFQRLRIGIGHPGQASQVTDYVLRIPPANEREQIESAIERALSVMPLIVSGDLPRAMNQLHSKV